MIPVPKSEVTPYKINDEGDLKYKMLVLNEFYFIRDNRDKIEKTARNLYEKKIEQLKHGEIDNPLLQLTLDFPQLEVLCNNWPQKGFSV